MDFVGAVEDGQNGAVGFDFISPHDGTKAKKSWFFFDQSYVCLGTAIQGNRDLAVVTTVDQVLKRSPVSIYQSEKTASELPEGKHKIHHLKWLYHGNVGYIFPDDVTINVSNDIQTGRWSDITEQKNISSEPVSEEVLKIWFDHGVNPRNGSYAYMVFPSVTEGTLKSIYESGTPYTILSNTKDLQAVKNTEEDEVQAVFYKSGNLSAANEFYLQMENSGIIMLQLKKGKVQFISLSDPTRKLKEIKFTLNGLYKVNSQEVIVKRDKESNSTQFTIQLPNGDFAGKSPSFELN